MTDNIKNLYHKDYLKQRESGSQDFLNSRVYDTLEKFFGSVLNRPFQGKLLDLGCGDGSFVQYSKSRGLDAVGIDINDGVNFERDSLPYKDGSFDIVFLYSKVKGQSNTRQKILQIMHS